MSIQPGFLFLVYVLLPFVMLFTRGFAASPSELTRGIVYEEHLGQKVSPGLTFVDDRGSAVKLGEYFRVRPVVVEMGYFRCPTLCGVSLNEITQTIEDFPPESASRDFEFIFVSVDPRETFVTAAAEKAEYLRRLAWHPAADRWHFLTGAQSAAQLAAQIGFHYRYDPIGKQYIHPGGLVVLSPQGEITSYLLGIQYPAADFERAMENARRGETGAIGELISVLCLSNDPKGSLAFYVMIALRIGALLMCAGLVLIVRAKHTQLRRKVGQT
jgi:protein SCO1